MGFKPLLPAVIATMIATTCAIAAARFLHADPRTRFLLPLSGGILLLVALLGLLPEGAETLGWLRVIALAAAGYLVLVGLDRVSHARLSPGLAAPLVTAAAIHAFVDGWGLVTVQVGDPHLAVSVSFAILLHKIPEGLALGTMLRAASRNPAAALLLCLLAEMPTLLGGLIGLWATPVAWVQYPLAFAAGTFVFLGVHALRASSKFPYPDSAS